MNANALSSAETFDAGKSRPSIHEPARDVPVVQDVDVLVVGGSCTGVFAAVRAARLGMRVAIVEKQNCFGGIATAGMVYMWHNIQDTRRERVIIAGLTKEVLDRLKRRDAASGPLAASGHYKLNTEELKIELDELVVSHKIIPFLHTHYVAPVKAGDALAAVIVENKNGRQAIRARQFVDATGDADLARHLGLPAYAPETCQPPTMCFKVCGWESLGTFNWQQAVSEHGAEFGLEKDWGWGGSLPNMPDIQLRADTHVFQCDASDANQLTQGELEGRRQVRAILDVIRNYGPPESKVHLVALAATLGIRESRRIVARYRLSGEDVLGGRRFDDAIANGSYRVDIHHAEGPGITFRYLDGTEVVVPERHAPPRKGRWRPPLPEDPTFYQIPFRCLLQDTVPNLMLAGRMLDADKAGFSAARVMVNTNQTGEAAGVACALAIQAGTTVQAVDAQRLRRTLAEGGSLIV